MANRKETFFLITGLLALFTVIILIPVETQEIPPTMERNGWGSQQSGTQPHCAQTYYFYLEHDDGTRDKIGQATQYCNI